MVSRTFKNGIKASISCAITAASIMSLSACGVFGDKLEESKNWPAEQLYKEAKDELSSGSYERAVSLFEKLESRFPFGTYAQQSQMDIAYAYYKSGDPAQALAAVERFIKLHPNHPYVDYMYYLRGLINFNEDSSWISKLTNQDMTERDPKALRDSFDGFKELVTRFPNSQYTPDALARMKYLVNALAQYDLHVAKYYYRRKAYIAAINRAQSAIKEYPDAPAIEEALVVLVKSYDAIGMTDLRDDTQRVFDKNYPSSKAMAEFPRTKPWWNFWGRN